MKDLRTTITGIVVIALTTALVAFKLVAIPEATALVAVGVGLILAKDA